LFNEVLQSAIKNQSDRKETPYLKWREATISVDRARLAGTTGMPHLTL